MALPPPNQVGPVTHTNPGIFTRCTSSVTQIVNNIGFKGWSPRKWTWPATIIAGVVTVIGLICLTRLYAQKKNALELKNLKNDKAREISTDNGAHKKNEILTYPQALERFNGDIASARTALSEIKPDSPIETSENILARAREALGLAKQKYDLLGDKSLETPREEQGEAWANIETALRDLSETSKGFAHADKTLNNRKALAKTVDTTTTTTVTTTSTTTAMVEATGTGLPSDPSKTN
jgi:hypothetical protein